MNLNRCKCRDEILFALEAGPVRLHRLIDRIPYHETNTMEALEQLEEAGAIIVEEFNQNNTSLVRLI